MKKDFSIFYIFCFIVALAAVGLFYFNYYGINVEISNEEVKEKINNKLPKEIDTSIGNFIVKEIQ
ncbi:hypothetical protein, partial [Oleiphilus sp. HI0123]|uniref:hypothetical protein n=1 Tax=Oleiphilus sp. HI0123 TaxID=1822265 RepID=UPI000A6920C1